VEQTQGTMPKETTSFEPPNQREVHVYFVRLGLEEKHSDAFFYYYSMKNWALEGGQRVKNWKVLAFNWVRSFSKAKPIRNSSIHC
jgi:hypothetical protein